ncbi:MAG: alpha-mannosidase [Kouleothrix sp.]|nr:alpha-mannosidase [Kouleothrix sp.]
MLLTLEKLKARVPQIIAAAVRVSLPLDELQTYAVPGPAADTAMAPPPAADHPGWAPIRSGERWGVPHGADPNETPQMLIWQYPASGGSSHWLRATIRVPEGWRGGQALLAMDWEGRSGNSVESIAYLDGCVLAGLDEFHRAILLPPEAHDGPHELLIRCLVPSPQPFGGLTLQLRDQAIFRLGATMRALLQAAETYRDSDLARHDLISRLDRAYNALDLREGWGSARFAESSCDALDLLINDQRPTTNDQRVDESLVLRPSSLVPTIVATGHAHLDVGWLWPVWRTRQKVAHTVASALHLMERYPEYHFSMSQPQTYAFLQADVPELYERLKLRAAEGRFEPVGLMWLETDCNIPSGESLVRQLSHGARFFAEEFGALNHVVWLPDVFGYSAALPQLMRGCGISCFMTTKISWSQFNRMPADTFRWRGIDGSEVLTHFVTTTDQPVRHPADAQTYTYVGQMTAGELFGSWNHYRQKPINDELLYIFGHGDGGGGPTEEMLETARALSGLPGFPQVRHGRVDQFFERLYERVWDDPRLPTWAGELYLEYHRGTYTSQSRTKQANRAAELLYREAEWLNAWAVTLGDLSRQAELDAGWKLILLNQFHDILPGSSIPQVYADSARDYAEVTRIGREVRDAAIAGILTSGQRPMTNDSHDGDLVARPSSLVVFNSLPWERQECVAIPAAHDLAEAPAGAQLVETLSGERALLVEVELPAYGYADLGTWDLGLGAGGRAQAPSPKPQASRSALSVQRSALQSGELRLELDDAGEIASLYDLRHGRELIAPGATGNQLVLYEDRPLSWDAWDVDAFYEEKPYPARDVESMRVVEAGPLRAAIEIVRKVGRSTIRQRICLWRGSRRIDFATEVDWQERQMLLRALFPLNLNAARATCEIQFGAVERPTHRNTSWDWARFEVCAQRWVDLSEGGYGVALLNDGKYGHSLRDNVLGLSLLKAGAWPDPEADRGMHRFTYSLLPHEGDWREGQVVRRAYELNAPLRTVERSNVQTFERSNRSFLSTPTDHVVVETVKVADDGDGLIVRLYEAHNQRGPASLRFGLPIAGAAEVDLLEREIGPVEIAGDELRFQVRPFEVKTLRVRLTRLARAAEGASDE